jgi:hypothetical protein
MRIAPALLGLALLSLTTSANAVEPIAAFNFNISSSTQLDATGNGNDASCGPCPTFAATGGPSGDGAYTWSEDGTPDLFLIDGSALNLHTNNAMTVAFDLYTANLGSDNNASLIARTGQIWIKKDGSNARTYFDVINNAISGSAAISDGTEVDSPTPTWHHVAYVFDGSAGTFEIFVDGASAGSTSGVTGTLTSNFNDVKITASVATAEFAGSIDNLRFYDVALDSDAIATIDGVPVTSIVASIATETTPCVAPCFKPIDATGTTDHDPDVVPFRDLDYYIDYDDAGGTWAYSGQPLGSDTAAFAGHVYLEPGDYTPSVEVTGLASGVDEASLTSFTVQDADTYFASSTWCFSNDTDFHDCPVDTDDDGDCSEDSSKCVTGSDFDNALITTCEIHRETTTDKRCLFKTGDQFDVSVGIDIRNNSGGLTLIGPFGTGSKPVIDGSAATGGNISNESAIFTMGTSSSTASDFTVFGLKFIGNNPTPQVSQPPPNHVVLAGNGRDSYGTRRFLLYDLEITDLSQAIAFAKGGSVNNDVGAVVDVSTSGAFLRSVGTYTGARFFSAGNTGIQPTINDSGASRLFFVWKMFWGHNSHGGDSTRDEIKYPGSCAPNGAVGVPDVQQAGYWSIVHNRLSFVGDTGDGGGFGGYNKSSGGGECSTLSNARFGQNYVEFSGRHVGAKICGIGTKIDNNIFFQTTTAGADSSARSAIDTVDEGGDCLLVYDPSGYRILNNTFRDASDTNAVPPFINLSTSSSDMAILGSVTNFPDAPSGGALTTGASPDVTGGHQLDVADSAFEETGAFDAPSDFTPASGSSLISGGQDLSTTTVDEYNRRDFFGNCRRRTGYADAGAIERGASACP